MTFSNPAAWGLLLLAIPIILFFFIKVRFRQEQTATNIFWQQVFDERRLRVIHRRFRYFASLLFALLLLSCLTAAVTEPVPAGTKTERCVFILDCSISMNAQNRFGDAGRQMRKLFRQLSDTEIAVLSAESPPKILMGFSKHSRTFRVPSPSSAANDLPAAVQLAERLLADQEERPIYLFTDGCFPQAEALTAKPNIHILQVGTPADNTAITKFQPRRLPENPTDYEILVEIGHFGSERTEPRLTVKLNDDIIDSVPLVLEPEQIVTKIIRSTSADGGTLRGTLETEDALPQDNTAECLLAEQPVQQIFLYGKENFFVQNILLSQPLTSVTVIKTIPNSLPSNSVLVLHQTVPSILPPGNVLIIDPQNGCDLFQTATPLPAPVGKPQRRRLVAKTDDTSPLLRFVHLQGMTVASTKEIIVNKATPRILAQTAENHPVYTLIETEAQKVLVLTADLNQGDFTLRAAFPILMSHALTFFRGAAQDGHTSAVRLASESNLRGGKIDLPAGGEMPIPPLWRYAALAALLLALTEWFLYQRRWVE